MGYKYPIIEPRKSITQEDRMSEPTAQMEALSPECEAYLASQEMYSTADPKSDCVRANIYTAEGDLLARVNAEIGLFDLQAILRVQRNEYARGFEAGKSAKQQEIRSVLGIVS